MKTYKEILQLQYDTYNEISLDPEKAFEKFRILWHALTFPEKRLYAPQVIRKCYKIINTDQDNSSPYFVHVSNYKLQQICCSEIYNFIDDELSDKISIGSLKLGAKTADIAAVFKIMVDMKYIDNSLVEVEEILIKLFNLPDNTSISSYFNDNSKLIAAAKRLVDITKAWISTRS